MLETIYVENSEQFFLETDLKNCSLIFLCVQMKKITYFYVYVYLLIIEEKKKGNLSLVSSSTIEVQKRAFTTLAQVFFFFFMKLKYLKLDLYSKLEFHELEFQKSGILLLILQIVTCC